MAPPLPPLSQEVRKKSLHFMLQEANPRIPEVAWVAQDSLPGMMDTGSLPLSMCPEFQVPTTCVIYSLNKYVNIGELTVYQTLN